MRRPHPTGCDRRGREHQEVAVKAFAVVVAVLLGGAAVATGQIHGTGFVQGRTVDVSDEPVTDVTVTATNAETGGTLSGKSDAKGEWKVIGFGRGQWELTFEKKGFEPSKAKAYFETDHTRVWPFTIKLKKSGA
jgi:hypothetical protein